MLVAQAAEQYAHAANKRNSSQMKYGLFTGRELAQDDMDVMMQAIMDEIP